MSFQLISFEVRTLHILSANIFEIYSHAIELQNLLPLIIETLYPWSTKIYSSTSVSALFCFYKSELVLFQRVMGKGEKDLLNVRSFSKGYADHGWDRVKSGSRNEVWIFSVHGRDAVLWLTTPCLPGAYYQEFGIKSETRTPI